MRLVFALTGLWGCTAPCDSPSYLNGTYASWSNAGDVLEDLPETNIEEAPLYELFWNGWSEWGLTYIASIQGFELTIDGQVFDALYNDVDETCNTFGLQFEGTVFTDAGTEHDFTWKAEALRSFGTHVGGTFQYEDIWSSYTGSTGAIAIPNGEISANSVTGG